MAGVDLIATAFNGANAAFIGDLYARWAGNPASVDPSFGDLFSALNDEARAALSDATGASWAPRHFAPEPREHTVSAEEVRAAAEDSLRALMLIRAYRVRGHLEADLDPLHIQVPKPHPELDPSTYGFTEADRDRPIFIDNVLGRDTATIREITDLVRAAYCGPIGVEFMHIQDPAQKSWIQRRFEGAPWRQAATPELKKRILTHLTEAEGFEAFCQKRFVGTKRFGLEGGEVTIAALHEIIHTAAADGVNDPTIA